LEKLREFSLRAGKNQRSGSDLDEWLRKDACEGGIRNHPLMNRYKGISRMSVYAWPPVLTKFAQKSTFESVLAEVFGPTVDWDRARSLQAQWRSGDFSALPLVVPLPKASMPTAAGAYARSTQTIYLNQDWLATATSSEVNTVLLEELGHYLEHVLVGEEAPSDEGKLFAARILGTRTNDFALTQNDSGFVTISGQSVAVEMSTFSTANQTATFNTNTNSASPSSGSNGGGTNFFNGDFNSQKLGDSPGSFNAFPPPDEFTPGNHSNSGLPTVTLTVSPGSAAEDDATKLIYTFTRTGDTTSVLSVNFTIGGTATYIAPQLEFSDYTQAGATSFSTTAGTVDFFPGSSTTTVEIAPQFDTLIEPNETVALTLAPGTGYEIGNVGTVTGTILNDDYQSVLPPTESAPLNHEFLEVLAKNLVYQDWDNDAARLEGVLSQFRDKVNGFEYRLDQFNGASAIWGSNAPNFYAIGLVADGAPPILVTRGTNDLTDWLSNINENGVGFDQFYNYRIAIDQWLNSLGSRGYSQAYITGHSLGGALAQWFASYYTSFRQQPLAGVVTYNAPGISKLIQKGGEEFGTSAFRKNLVDDVTHYIANGDIVSLFGDDFIDGNISKFSRTDTWAHIPFSPHLDPLLIQELPENQRSRPEGFYSSLGINQLNSPIFNFYGHGYSSLQYAALQVLVSKIPALGPPLAKALSTRGSLNRNLDIARSLANLSVEISDLGIAGLELVQEAVIAIGNGGVAALEAIQNWGVDAWEAASNLTADAWRNAQGWTAATWQSTADFTANQWDALVGTLSGAIDTTFNFISSTVSNIFNTSVTVSLSQPSDTEVVISYQSVDGTAIAGQDYVAVSGTLVFAPGETEKKVPIQLINKGSIDEAKTFEFQLSDPQNIELVLDNKILVNIKPNEAPTLQNPIASQTAFINEYFFLVIPEDTFIDADLEAGDQLRYDVTLANGDPLPSWLTFDSDNGFLVGTPNPTDLDDLTLKVTATDQATRSVSTEFGVDISISPDDVIGPASASTASRFIGNRDNNIFSGSREADIFNLNAGGANIILGTLAQLNNDRVQGFTSDDVLLIEGDTLTTAEFSVTPESATLNFDTDGDGTVDYSILLEGDYRQNKLNVTPLDGLTKVSIISQEADINNAPSFTASNPDAVDEDSGPVTVTDWAAFDPGAGDTNQTATFIISSITNPDLFSVAPAIAADGTLTFTPADNQFGTSDFTVQVQDSGGTDNGGVDTSAEQTFTIAVNAVNDAPVFAEEIVDLVFEFDPAVGSKVYTASATDEDGDVLTYRFAAGNDHSSLAIDPTTGEITVADESFLGPATPGTEIPTSWTVQVSDQAGLQDTQKLNFSRLVQLNTVPPDEGDNIYNLFFKFDSVAKIANAGGIDLPYTPIEIGGINLGQIFDNGYYLRNNPDVARAVAAGAFKTSFEHFVQHGLFEGRDSNLFFDEQTYLATYDDVAIAVEKGTLASGYQHFLLHGHFEGREPGGLFFEESYLRTYPDVAQAVKASSFSSGFEHYVEYGRLEGRGRILSLYQENDYLRDNPDVAAAVELGTFANGFDHFVQFGAIEGRDPSIFFDNQGYLAANPDVANAVQLGAIPSGFVHYALYGAAEERTWI
jgi:hypothetical protein